MSNHVYKQIELVGSSTTSTDDAIAKAIKAGKGKAELKTVNGSTLWAIMNGPKNVILQDEKGNIANISIYDVYQSNGVIHVIDAVVMP